MELAEEIFSIKLCAGCGSYSLNLFIVYGIRLQTLEPGGVAQSVTSLLQTQGLTFVEIINNFYGHSPLPLVVVFALSTGYLAQDKMWLGELCVPT